jgi:hypothetical protein
MNGGPEAVGYKFSGNATGMTLTRMSMFTSISWRSLLVFSWHHVGYDADYAYQLNGGLPITTKSLITRASGTSTLTDALDYKSARSINFEGITTDVF